MLEVSFAAAFAGGVLSLLAPCSALLLPAFFAYAFTSRTELLGRTLLFLGGLCTVFVPLGLGASLVAALLIDYRETTILIAGLLLIGFGLMELAGQGFSFLPAGLAARFQTGRGALAIYGTGLVYGISGFCSGPLLGAVLTIAGSSANPLLGAALLFTYSLGTAAPLFVIAWFWDRYQLGRRAWLRGRPLQLGPIRIFSTNLIAGTLFILLGISFIVFQGASALSVYYEDLGLGDLGFRAQLWAEENLARVPDLLWGALVLLLVLVVWARRARRERRAQASALASTNAAAETEEASHSSRSRLASPR
ncbi:MAG: cytochrome c biogenesis protein CcdA [Chloroflexi bacterium]|nr:cytochrome c biogenesis protein CcdA [Chloroflexota bacterium]